MRAHDLRSKHARSRAASHGMQEDPVAPPACVASVVDRRTGQVFVAHNAPKGANTNPAQYHPLMRSRLLALQEGDAHPSDARAHPEVLAVNEALLARQAKQISVPLQEQVLPEMTLLPMWYESRINSPFVIAGKRAPCCGSCSQITNGVVNAAGVASIWARDVDGKWTRQKEPNAY